MATVSDVKLAREALRASGVRSYATWNLFLPFNRDRRLHGVLRRRCAVLEAKNGVLDCLFRFQRAIEPLNLRSVQDVRKAMEDPTKKKAIIGVGLNRGSLEDELGRFGIETGESLDIALGELMREKRVVKTMGSSQVVGAEIYLVMHHRGRSRYSIATLSKLVQRAQNLRYGNLLRNRTDGEKGNSDSREYRM